VLEGTDLARVVDASESRHINAKRIIEIILSKFSPMDVEEAVNKLFEDPSWDRPTLNGAIVEALRQLDGRLRDSPRTVDSVAAVLSQDEKFKGITKDDIFKAIVSLASSSQGALVMDGEKLIKLTSYDELDRRVASQTSNGGIPLRGSKIRADLSTQVNEDESK
jgi:hypothetical protein